MVDQNGTLEENEPKQMFDNAEDLKWLNSCQSVDFAL